MIGPSLVGRHRDGPLLWLRQRAPGSRRVLRRRRQRAGRTVEEGAPNPSPIGSARRAPRHRRAALAATWCRLRGRSPRSRPPAGRGSQRCHYPRHGRRHTRSREDHGAERQRGAAASAAVRPSGPPQRCVRLRRVPQSSSTPSRARRTLPLRAIRPCRWRPVSLNSISRRSRTPRPPQRWRRLRRRPQPSSSWTSKPCRSPRRECAAVSGARRATSQSTKSAENPSLSRIRTVPTDLSLVDRHSPAGVFGPARTCDQVETGQPSSAIDSTSDPHSRFCGRLRRRTRCSRPLGDPARPVRAGPRAPRRRAGSTAHHGAAAGGSTRRTPDAQPDAMKCSLFFGTVGAIRSKLRRVRREADDAKPCPPSEPTIIHPPRVSALRQLSRW